MKHLGWIIAGVVLVWYFFFRQTIIVTGANNSTSGGIATGGTSSPTADTTPLNTVNQAVAPGIQENLQTFGTSHTRTNIMGLRSTVSPVPARQYILPSALAGAGVTASGNRFLL